MKFKTLLLAVFVFTGAVNAASSTAADHAVAATTSILTRAKEAIVNAAATTKEAVVNAATKAKDAVAVVPSKVKTGCEDLVNSKCVQAQVKFVQDHKVAVAVTAVVAAAAITYAVCKKNQKDKKN